MKKLFLMMAVAIASIGVFSCTPDPDEQVRTHYYTIATHDCSWGLADLEYLWDFFNDDVRMFSIEGTLKDANAQALKRYNDILDQIDNDYVCSRFPSYDYENLEEYLYAEVDLILPENGVIDTLATRRWTINGVE